MEQGYFTSSNYGFISDCFTFYILEFVEERNLRNKVGSKIKFRKVKMTDTFYTMRAMLADYLFENFKSDTNRSKMIVEEVYACVKKSESEIDETRSNYSQRLHSDNSGLPDITSGSKRSEILDSDAPFEVTKNLMIPRDASVEYSLQEIQPRNLCIQEDMALQLDRGWKI
ncbi:hypothetical protein DASC09_001760 [Saccharomycopsis crataegensis]|uniref:Uncharacterized protein n=1 Tax=Saccharomycopsis crataegensis TaxID=43959 RepID=A0AAV5QE46_9ASCO|nr:hypothetical protein DASC09_001760 [Saccharomycopsis crataegensis]